jgi:hypothetical protein
VHFDGRQKRLFQIVLLGAAADFFGNFLVNFKDEFA